MRSHLQSNSLKHCSSERHQMLDEVHAAAHFSRFSYGANRQLKRRKLTRSAPFTCLRDERVQQSQSRIDEFGTEQLGRLIDHCEERVEE